MEAVTKPLELRVPLCAAEHEAAKRTVCVTGASGYVAAFVVQRLLAAGHTGAWVLSTISERGGWGMFHMPDPCQTVLWGSTPALPLAALPHFPSTACPLSALANSHPYPAHMRTRTHTHTHTHARTHARAVHAAVRARAKAQFLTRLPGAGKHLRVFEGCDLLVPGSFDAAVAGCDCVMHTASPFAIGVRCGGRPERWNRRGETAGCAGCFAPGRHQPDLAANGPSTPRRADKVQETLIKPAVEGTRNVLGEQTEDVMACCCTAGVSLSNPAPAAGCAATSPAPLLVSPWPLLTHPCYLCTTVRGVHLRMHTLSQTP
jgi:hypothetical protein